MINNDVRITIQPELNPIDTKKQQKKAVGRLTQFVLSESEEKLATSNLDTLKSYMIIPTKSKVILVERPSMGRKLLMFGGAAASQQVQAILRRMSPPKATGSLKSGTPTFVCSSINACFLKGVFNHTETLLGRVLVCGGNMLTGGLAEVTGAYVAPLLFVVSGGEQEFDGGTITTTTMTNVGLLFGKELSKQLMGKGHKGQPDHELSPTAQKVGKVVVAIAPLVLATAAIFTIRSIDDAVVQIFSTTTLSQITSKHTKAALQLYGSKTARRAYIVANGILVGAIDLSTGKLIGSKKLFTAPAGVIPFTQLLALRKVSEKESKDATRLATEFHLMMSGLSSDEEITKKASEWFQSIEGKYNKQVMSKLHDKLAKPIVKNIMKLINSNGQNYSNEALIKVCMLELRKVKQVDQKLAETIARKLDEHLAVKGDAEKIAEEGLKIVENTSDPQLEQKIEAWFKELSSNHSQEVVSQVTTLVAKRIAEATMQFAQNSKLSKDGITKLFAEWDEQIHNVSVELGDQVAEFQEKMIKKMDRHEHGNCLSKMKHKISTYKKEIGRALGSIFVGATAAASLGAEAANAELLEANNAVNTGIHSVYNNISRMFGGKVMKGQESDLAKVGLAALQAGTALSLIALIQGDIDSDEPAVAITFGTFAYELSLVIRNGVLGKWWSGKPMWQRRIKINGSNKFKTCF